MWRKEINRYSFFERKAKEREHLSLGAKSQDGLLNTRTVLSISTLEVSDLTFANVLLGVLQVTSNVVDQVSLLLSRHETIQITSLDEIIISQTISEAASGTADFLSSESGTSNVGLVGTTERVGFIVGGGATVAQDGHGTITLVVSNTRVRLVDGDLSIVGTKTMTVSIRVREETALQHAIGRDINTRDSVRRREGSLLSLGKVILRVTVQCHLTNRLERVILMISIILACDEKKSINPISL